MYFNWFKMGKGGSYNGYIKPRDPISKVSKAQREQRNRFREAALECKGKDQVEFRQCMSEEL